MKTKSLENVQENCDEWLSTRNKRKIFKPIIRKRYSTSKVPNFSFGLKLWQMTQTTPPPLEIFTNTKQSVLMKYFTKKNIKNTEESNESFEHRYQNIDVDFNQDEGVDLNKDKVLTDQLGVLSQEAAKIINDTIDADKVSDFCLNPNITSNSTLSSVKYNFHVNKFQNIVNTDNNKFGSHNTSSKRSKTSNCSVIKEDIEFISQTSIVKNVNLKPESEVLDKRVSNVNNEYQKDSQINLCTKRKKQNSKRITKSCHNLDLDIEFVRQSDVLTNDGNSADKRRKNSIVNCFITDNDRLLSANDIKYDANEGYITIRTDSDNYAKRVSIDAYASDCTANDGSTGGCAEKGVKLEDYSVLAETSLNKTQNKRKRAICKLSDKNSDSDIDFVSQSVGLKLNNNNNFCNISNNNNNLLKDKYISIKSQSAREHEQGKIINNNVNKSKLSNDNGTKCDMEFVSLGPASITPKHNSLNSTYKIMVNNFCEDSDIEFLSQSPKSNTSLLTQENQDSTKILNNNLISDYGVSYGRQGNDQNNKDDKWYSQLVSENSPQNAESDVCDGVYSSPGYWHNQNHTLNINYNTEDFESQHFFENDKHISAELFNNYHQLQSMNTVNTLKKDNSTSITRRLLQPLPDTIKFTDTETDSFSNG